MASHPHFYTANGGDIDGCKMPIRGCRMGVCVLCGRQQPMPKAAWFRKTRPTCPACGGMMEPSLPAQKATVLSCKNNTATQKRRCSQCGTNLNSYNPTDLCWTCAKGRTP